MKLARLAPMLSLVALAAGSGAFAQTLLPNEYDGTMTVTPSVWGSPSVMTQPAVLDNGARVFNGTGVLNQSVINGRWLNQSAVNGNRLLGQPLMNGTRLLNQPVINGSGLLNQSALIDQPAFLDQTGGTCSATVTQPAIIGGSQVINSPAYIQGVYPDEVRLMF